MLFYKKVFSNVYLLMVIFWLDIGYGVDFIGEIIVGFGFLKLNCYNLVSCKNC